MTDSPTPHPGLPVAHFVLDCADGARLAPFWAAALGFEQAWTLGQFTGLEDPDGKRIGLILQQVPEAKTIKNRAHMDLGAHDLEMEVTRLEGLGATRIIERREGPAHWVVMHDPEGNEFCVTELPG
jgi:predicted enzyme related to lactoylglutathione lyase